MWFCRYNVYCFANKFDLINLDWFPGWPQFGYYGRQPSDDGLSREDCVEIRKTFMFPSKGEEMMTKPYWNDRECEEKNAYICQKRMAGGECKNTTTLLCKVGGIQMLVF